MSKPELKIQLSVFVCWPDVRIGVGERDSMPSRLVSEEAEGSIRLEVPETARLMAVVTMSMPSMSDTVRVPEVARAALVSVRDAVLELPVPTVMVGASLLAFTVMATVSVADENAVAAPVEVVLTLLPLLPED